MGKRKTGPSTWVGGRRTMSRARGRAGWNVGAYRRHARIRAGQRGVLRVGGYYGRFAHSNGSGELKFHDVQVDEAAADWSAGIIQNSGTLNVIPQDVTEKTRVGRKVTIKSIMWRGAFSTTAIANGATVQNSEVVRVIIYLDKQCNGATAAVTDILESANFQSYRNLSNSNRFVTLMDKTFVVIPEPPCGTSAANDQGQRTTNKTFYKKCNIKLEYDDSAQTGAIGTIRSNNIGMLVISRSSATNVGMAGKVRMRFSDS